VNETVTEDDTEWILISTVGEYILLYGPEDAARVVLTVFDAAGREVDRIHLTGYVTWGDGHNPGVYFVTSNPTNPGKVNKVALIKES
jgi:hypothetical protein